MNTWSDLNIKVGVFSKGGSYSNDGGEPLSSADVALINEMGSGNIPARPFISDSFYESEDIVEPMLEGFLFEKNTKSLSRDIGKILKQMMQQRIIESSSHYQANAPTTIERKGFDHPLVETGRMLGDVNFKVGGED